MSGALQACVQIAQGAVAAFGVAGAPRQIGLQPHGGQRCAQLVRGVGDEAPLVVERLPQPRQQIVEGMDQRYKFRRQPV